uniref:Plectin/eS10 N-terminal domain-containing protein n=1 Tax=Chaetoceros debilis TaxID=122233 RepID=A0A7S3QJ16_9STRA|mmetsp:Transcript_20618/g.31310  ORF Transcript_20618/g.31310 Transcript_20618/m.31310 type:complete len:143 (+) Transcript_20618:74-502(+)|eukprot:CAMPEP_0194072380 /NCGR_PEP_ID=MMETSP0149-20130528/139_1 /TAXON_ID=122233 /ORGANISM="Chaetoceros debilis, Strain MM31A-1" /LENGTH=142 /DNA_ID=CAMNT_0038752259 /DNA_START=82 /DNA_END=510 /DNA_ORIENTATION=-
MFIPKANRIAVFKYLFSEGVLVVKKDTISATHPQIEGPTNLEVLMLVKSLESKEYVRVTFNWQYNYVYLTPEGIEYLRTYLALPAEVVPATHRKVTGRPEGRDREEEGNGGKFGGEGRAAFRGGGDREYRGREGGFGRGGGL